MSLDEWDEGQEAPVNLEQMDQMIADYRKLRDEYDDLKKVASDKWAEVEEIQNKVIKALEAAGKKSYKVDGVGTFGIVYKQVVGMPKSVEGKEALFSHIKKEYGEETLLSMQTVNWQSLNSFFNAEAEKSGDPMFLFPGMDAPTTRTEPRFTKAKT